MGSYVKTTPESGSFGAPSCWCPRACTTRWVAAHAPAPRGGLLPTRLHHAVGCCPRACTTRWVAAHAPAPRGGLLPTRLHHAVLRAWYPSIDKDGSLCLDQSLLPSEYRDDHSNEAVPCMTALLLAAAVLSGGRPVRVWAACPAPAPPAATAAHTAPGAAGTFRGSPDGAGVAPDESIAASASGESSAAASAGPQRKRCRYLQLAARHRSDLLLRHPASAVSHHEAATTPDLEELVSKFMPSSQLTRLHLKHVGMRTGGDGPARRLEGVQIPVGGVATAPQGGDLSWYTALAQLRQLRALHVVSSRGIHGLAAPALMESLSQLTDLHELTLERPRSVPVIEDIDVWTLFLGLHALPRLTKLALVNTFHAYEPPAGMVRMGIAALARLTRLTHLRIEWRAASADHAWLQLLSHAFLALPGIRRLFLGNDNPSSARSDQIRIEAHAGESDDSLQQSTDVQSRDAAAPVVQETAHVPLHSTGLREIRAQGCLLGRSNGSSDHEPPPVAGARVIADIISSDRAHTVQMLDVSYSSFGDVGLQVIADALPTMQSLTQLRMGCNRESHEGVVTMLQAARKLPAEGGRGLRQLRFDLTAVPTQHTRAVAACVSRLREMGLEQLRVGGSWSFRRYTVDFRGLGPVTCMSEQHGEEPEVVACAKGGAGSGGGDVQPLLEVMMKMQQSKPEYESLSQLQAWSMLE